MVEHELRKQQGDLKDQAVQAGTNCVLGARGGPVHLPVVEEGPELAEFGGGPNDHTASEEA